MTSLADKAIKEAASIKQPSTHGVLNWLNRVVEGKFFINDDGSVDVEGSVSIVAWNEGLQPVQFGKVTKNFYLSGLDSGEEFAGYPRHVGENFGIYYRETTRASEFEPPGFVPLTPSVPWPDFVGGTFALDAEITKLGKMPEVVLGNLILYSSRLKSMDGAPRCIGKDLYLYGINKPALKSCSIFNGFPDVVAGDCIIDISESFEPTRKCQELCRALVDKISTRVGGSVTLLENGNDLDAYSDFAP